MKRNIVQQGPTTLMISLPIKWVKKYDLKKGGQLEVEERGRQLVISTESQVEKTSTEVNLLDDEYIYVFRMLSYSYLNGYDEIKVNYTSFKQLELVQGYVVKYFLGFDIVEQQKNYCVIRNISGDRLDEFDSILRRIFLSLIQMSKIYKSYLEDGEDPSLLLSLERTNNRQTYVLKRLINKEGFRDEKRKTFAFTMIFLLEQIANEFKFSLWYIQGEKNVNVTKKIVDTYSRLHEEILNVYSLYYKYDENLARKIIVDDLKTSSATGENLDLFEDDANLAHSIINITEKIRYIAFQIIGLNS